MGYFVRHKSMSLFFLTSLPHAFSLAETPPLHKFSLKGLGLGFFFWFIKIASEECKTSRGGRFYAKYLCIYAKCIDLYIDRECCQFGEGVYFIF